MKINWKQKLSSRKLWAAIAAAVITILTAIFKEELSAEAVDLIGKGVIALCVYIFGEGIVDVARQIWSAATETTETIVSVEIPSGATTEDVDKLIGEAITTAADEGTDTIKITLPDESNGDK